MVQTTNLIFNPQHWSISKIVHYDKFLIKTLVTYVWSCLVCVLHVIILEHEVPKISLPALLHKLSSIEQHKREIAGWKVTVHPRSQWIQDQGMSNMKIQNETENFVGVNRWDQSCFGCSRSNSSHVVSRTIWCYYSLICFVKSMGT